MTMLQSEAASPQQAASLVQPAAPRASEQVFAEWCESMFARFVGDAAVSLGFVGVAGFEAEDAVRTLGAAPQGRLLRPALLPSVVEARARQTLVVSGALPGQAGPNSEQTYLCLPVMVEAEVAAMVVVEAEFADKAAFTRFTQTLHMGSGWLVAGFLARRAEEKLRLYDTAEAALTVVALVAQCGDFLAACEAAVTNLAATFDCDRVSIGEMRRNRGHILAISNSAQFSRNLRDVRHIRYVIEEAVDQETPLMWPPLDPNDANILRAHQSLSADANGTVILTVPFLNDPDDRGAFVFERPSHKAFSNDEIEILMSLVAVMDPILDEMRLNNRWIGFKLLASGKQQFKNILGPGYFLVKTLTLAAILSLVALIGIQQTYAVPADATVEGSEQRILSASFDGFIAQVNAREGNHVAKGEVLLRLDDRDLALQRLRLTTQRSQDQLEFDRALASRDRSQMAISQSRVAQADAQIALIDNQLERAQLRAPFDGIVIQGDLTHAVGASVTRGQPLMTIAPAGDFRIALTVNERQIDDIRGGQNASLRLTALPSETFPLVIEDILPVAHYGQGQTRFSVSARLLGSAAPLRHGMQGVARVEVESRRLGDIWFRPIVNWLRSTLWSRWLI